MASVFNAQDVISAHYGVSPHTFRHTFARMFLERGGEVYRLSRLMGHTDVKVTEKYRKRLYQQRGAARAESVLSSRGIGPEPYQAHQEEREKRG